MRAFVTGGTGMVGRSFVRRALEEGWEIVLVTRQPERARESDPRRVTVFEGDICDEQAMSRVARTAGPFDVVVHLAASLQYFGDEWKLHETNVIGTRNALRVAIDARAPKFVHASSIEAQGPVPRWRIPARASHSCRPVSPYGRSKLAAERLVIETGRDRFSTAILRIGNVYAPDRPSFVVEIADAILRRTRLLEFLPVYADRYVHPAHTMDVAAGILAAATSPAAHTVVTLGGEYATVGDLFQLCADFLGRRLPHRRKRALDDIYLRLRRELHKRRRAMDFITYLMAGRGLRIHRAYSLQELRQLLGFSPSVSLSAGVRETLTWACESGALRARGC